MKAPKLETRLRKAKKYLNTVAPSPYYLLENDIKQATRKFKVSRKKLKPFIQARKKDSDNWENNKGKWRH